MEADPLSSSSSSKFSYIDYGVFFLMLVITAVIGFYYAWKERHTKTVEQILLGGRKLKVVFVAL